jgi:hypothetical protein
MCLRTFSVERVGADVEEAGAAAVAFAVEAWAVEGGSLFRVMESVGGNLGRTCA